MDIFNAVTDDHTLMLYLKTFAVIWCTVLFIYEGIHAQYPDKSITTEDLKTFTEEKLGIDDLLVNGTHYIPQHAYATGSPDFEYTGNPESVLYVKGQSFRNIHIAYDIVSDHALLIRDFGNGLQNRIILFPAHIDSFTIANHLFVNPYNRFDSLQEKGYFEKISDGEVMFLKKYRKFYIKIYDHSNRGKYSPQKMSFHLMDKDGRLTAINSTAAFLNYFSKHKKNVRDYLNEKNIRLKKANSSDIRSLMYYCNSLIDETR